MLLRLGEQLPSSLSLYLSWGIGPARDACDQPIKAFKEAFPLGRWRLLDGPLSISQAGETQGLGNLWVCVCVDVDMYVCEYW